MIILSRGCLGFPKAHGFFVFFSFLSEIYKDCPISIFPKAIRQRETKSLGKR